MESNVYIKCFPLPYRQTYCAGTSFIGKNKCVCVCVCECVVRVSVCLSVSVSICFPVCLFVCLFVCVRVIFFNILIYVWML